MRLIKLFGLAAVAALAAMAFIGASSASAVVLCEENVETCPEAKIVPEGTQVDGELVTGTHATLLGGFFGNILCTGSTTKGQVLTHTATVLTGDIESLGFTGCTHTSNGSTCTATAEHLAYQSLLLLVEPGVWHVIVHEKSPNLVPRVHVSCTDGLVNCTFKSPETLFTIDVNATDTDWLVEQTVEREGGFCPSTSVWDAHYLTRCLKANHTEFLACFPAMNP